MSLALDILAGVFAAALGLVILDRINYEWALVVLGIGVGIFLALGEPWLLVAWLLAVTLSGFRTEA